ncbi:vacuolar protein sorting-associated protein 37A-like [Scleropages formosus]|uniref:Vacuolar protein sorting-associated protein 37A-like n=1 Tax=Scleropages formosus TaxID=113540 RepID=A0A0P7WEM2_SCLFO|nr:vacuolar protein sorting-associated protein 37A-like [Scleropages formosus]
MLGSAALPPLTSLQQQRQRQIESLKAAHPTIAEIQKDVEYRVPFTVNNTTISVNILLPPQFPQEKPVVSVYPPVGHHLVDSTNGTMVTSPLVTNVSVRPMLFRPSPLRQLPRVRELLTETTFCFQFAMHSDLGKTVQSILDEFWKSPPAVIPGPPGFPFPAHVSSMYKASGIAAYTAPPGFHFLPAFPPQEGTRPVGPAPLPHPGTEPHATPRAAAPAYGLITDLPLPVPTADSQAGLNGHLYKMPEIPDTFPELSEMSISQLKDLNEQDPPMLDFFMCLPQLKQVCSDKEELVGSIVDMAKRNLLLEPQLEGKRQEMLFKYEQLTQMKSAFETKMQRQHELAESCSLSALQARLKVAAHQAEEESEKTAEDFLNGKSEIDNFLTSFMEKRTAGEGREASAGHQHPWAISHFTLGCYISTFIRDDIQRRHTN